MNQRINIDDIAQAAGVSKATVSQVLRNAGRISPETREQVMKVAQSLGYVYNRAAANLRAGQSTTVGIGVSSLSNPFFAELVSGRCRDARGRRLLPDDRQCRGQSRSTATLRHVAARKYVRRRCPLRRP